MSTPIVNPGIALGILVTLEDFGLKAPVEFNVVRDSQ